MNTNPLWNTASNREAESGITNNTGPDSVEGVTDDQGTVDYLATARLACSTSERYMSTNLRTRWSKSYRAFQSRHSEGSKYNSKRYRGRSGLFRPKTRAIVRKADAQVAQAYFATHDIVQMTPENDGDPLQLAGAKLQHEIMNLRLDRANTDHGIPWFLTVIGAHQDSKIAGICASKQSWLYEEDIVDYHEELVVDPETGEEYVEEVPVAKKRVSRPNVELFPPECVLRDPSANWIDQAQLSSYVILKYPMTVADVRNKMDENNPIGQSWKPVDDSVLQNASTVSGDNSAVRRAREGTGTDRLDKDAAALEDFDIVWIHENFIRINGRDMHFWSVGAGKAYLTDPMPVEEVYPEQNGRRPIVIGYGQIESHKVDPQSQVESWYPLQMEVNDLVNLRLENVKQSVSPVTKVVRGKNVDVSQVQNRSADSVVWVNNPDDVIWDKVPDVSSSSYAEMDRLNVDFDDLAGTFSQGSVQSNRQLNETVGGMNLLNSNANVIGEFDIRVFNETWIEPTLRQLANLNAYYENDPKILSIAGAKAGLWDQYIEGMTDIDGLLLQNVQLRVDAGTAASDPMQRLQKLQAAAGALTAMIGPEKMMAMSQDEAIIEEVFGILGYKDGARFYDPQAGQADPRMQMIQEQMQMMGEEIKRLEAQLADGEADRENKIMIERIKSATTLVEEMLSLEKEQFKAGIQTQAQILNHHAGQRQINFQKEQAQLDRDNPMSKVA